MAREPTALEIVSALAQAGYFATSDFDPGRFIHVVERRFKLGAERALAILAAGDLTIFEYTPDPSVHLKDKLDLWRVMLTAAGHNVVSKQPSVDRLSDRGHR